MTMHEALRALSAQHRAAIIQTFFFKQSVSEHAQQERVSEDAVRRSLHEALHALRLAVSECGVTQ
jgi:RNA polymerase sigma-70 factor (ECF subfamily)